MGEKKENKKEAGYKAGIVALVIGIVLVLAWSFGVIGPHPASVVQNPATTPTAGKVALSRPIEFIVQNQYTGAPISGAQIYVYTADLSKQVCPPLTTDSSGKAITNNYYNSGQSFFVWVVWNDSGNYVYDSKVITLPYYSKENAQFIQYHMVNINLIPAGSYSISLIYNGKSYTNGDVMSLPAQSVPITISIINNQVNSGFKDVKDVKGDQLGAYLVITPSSKDLIIQGATKYVFGDQYVYIIKIPAQYLDKWQEVSGQITGGTYSTTVYVDASKITGNVTLTVQLVLYGDLNEFAQFDDWGHYAQTPVTLSLTVQKV